MIPASTLFAWRAKVDQCFELTRSVDVWPLSKDGAADLSRILDVLAAELTAAYLDAEKREAAHGVAP